MRLRRVWVGACLVLMVAACGGGEMSLTDYVDRLNAIVDRARQQYELLVGSQQGKVLVADAAQLTDFTPQDLQAALERQNEIGVEVMEAIDAIEPPELVADLHDFFFYSRFSAEAEALAARAGTAADWEELSESPEMAAYRAALAEDKQACADFQAQLDATEAGGAFADTPWVPREMSEVVEAVLGCHGYPEHPEDVFRPSPTSAP